MNEIPEDYTHAELWMKYKHYERKLEKVMDWIKNWEGDHPCELQILLEKGG